MAERPSVPAWRGVRPRALLALVAAVCVAVLAGCATTPTASTGAQARLTARYAATTARDTFHAYDAAGRLNVPVDRHTRGACWSTSAAAPGRGSYRCFAGNQILDPCFAKTGERTWTVACVADPWAKATVLTLTHPLPGASAGHRVWAFTRADGTRCVAATGTVPAVRARNLEYTCADGTFASLGDTGAKRVRAVYARATATTLRHSGVRALWDATSS